MKFEINKYDNIYRVFLEQNMESFSYRDVDTPFWLSTRKIETDFYTTP